MSAMLKYIARRNSARMTWKDAEDELRQDIKLVGCLTDDELFNGSSAVRAKKAQGWPKVGWWRGAGIAINHANGNPTGPSFIDFSFLNEIEGRDKR